MQLSLLTVTQVARLVGVSRITVYREIKRGRLKTCRAGRRIMVTPEQLKRWLGLRPTDGAADGTR